jgi:UrcA family protein
MRIPSLLIVALAVSAPAYTQPPITVVGDMPTARISAADLNLHSASGQARLQARIRTAAQTLCMDPAVRDVARYIAGRTCLSHALASARPQVDRLVRLSGTSADIAAATIIVRADR